MNRVGKTYMSNRPEGNQIYANGAVITVIDSERWSQTSDQFSNFTHKCIVLACPLDPKRVGSTVRVDERKWVTFDGEIESSWDQEDKYVEI